MICGNLTRQIASFDKRMQPFAIKTLRAKFDYQHHDKVFLESKEHRDSLGPSDYVRRRHTSARVHLIPITPRVPGALERRCEVCDTDRMIHEVAQYIRTRNYKVERTKVPWPSIYGSRKFDHSKMFMRIHYGRWEQHFSGFSANRAIHEEVRFVFSITACIACAKLLCVYTQQ